MFNFFLCIIWPVLIGGTVAIYIGVKKLGKKAVALLLSFVYIVFCLILLRLIFGEYWIDILWIPYFAQ